MTQPATGSPVEWRLTPAEMANCDPTILGLLLLWEPQVSNGFYNSQMKSFVEDLPLRVYDTEAVTLALRTWLRDTWFPEALSTVPVTSAETVIQSVPVPRRATGISSPNQPVVSHSALKKAKREAVRTSLVKVVSEKLREAGAHAVMSVTGLAGIPLPIYLELALQQQAAVIASGVNPNANVNAYRAQVVQAVNQYLRGQISVTDSQTSLMAVLEGLDYD